MEAPLLPLADVHNQFLCFADIQQENVLPAQFLQVGDLPPIGWCLIISPVTPVLSANSTMTLEFEVALQSWLYSEYSTAEG